MTGKSVFCLGQLDFDPRSGELRTRAETRRLEPKAAAVLQILCEQEGSVVTRQELLDRCWGDGEGSDEALTQAVAQVRRALDDLGEPGLVETLAKRGYRLKPAAPAPAVRTQPAEERKTIGRLVVPGAVLAGIAMLAVVIADPHAPRHFIRHALGLGPQTPTH